MEGKVSLVKGGLGKTNWIFPYEPGKQWTPHPCYLRLLNTGITGGVLIFKIERWLLRALVGSKGSTCHLRNEATRAKDEKRKGGRL